MNLISSCLIHRHILRPILQLVAGRSHLRFQLVPSAFYSNSAAHAHRSLLSPPDQSHNLDSCEASDLEDEEINVASSDQVGLPQFINLLSKARRLSSNCEALAFLRSYNIQTTENLIRAALWELRDEWEVALLAFRLAERQHSSSERNWNFMIWILCKENRFNIAWQLVRRMHRSGKDIRKALRILIRRYAAANEADKAVKTFNAMEMFGIIADSAAFYTLLHALCKHKNIEEAEELMFMNRKPFPLTTKSFNIILGGWCNVLVDVVEAKRIWREMSNCCIYPDVDSYTHMIGCFSKVGNLFDSVRLYDEMKKRGWKPNLSVYNSLIFVLAKENCTKEAHNLLDKIAGAGLHPNVHSYISLIYPLCASNKIEEAWNVLNEMRSRGIVLTAATFFPLAEVESMEGTLKLLSQMRGAGCGPDGSTFLVIFKKFFRWGMPGDVLRIWSVMEKYDLNPGYEHYVVLIKGLAHCGWLNKAREFYYGMKSKGFSDDLSLEKILRGSEVRCRKCKGQGRLIRDYGYYHR